MPIDRRATSVYAIMVVIFGVGLWAILQAGHFLKAPPDLAGEWETSPDARRMTVEQSGRFFVVSRDGWPRIDAKLSDVETLGDSTAPSVRLRIASDAWTVLAHGPPDGDAYQFQVTGPNVDETFEGRRVRRRYPADGKKRPATTQPATAPAPHAR